LNLEPVNAYLRFSRVRDKVFPIYPLENGKLIAILLDNKLLVRHKASFKQKNRGLRPTRTIGVTEYWSDAFKGTRKDFFPFLTQYSSTPLLHVYDLNFVAVTVL
jgi:hypothetical protein